VRYEISKIPDIDKWLHHTAIVDWLDYRQYNLNDHEILNRKTYFLKFHDRAFDCQILAEAESSKMNVLLTYDGDFKKNLDKKANGVSIISPLDFSLRLIFHQGLRRD